MRKCILRFWGILYEVDNNSGSPNYGGSRIYLYCPLFNLEISKSATDFYSYLRFSGIRLSFAYKWFIKEYEYIWVPTVEWGYYHSI